MTGLSCVSETSVVVQQVKKNYRLLDEYLKAERHMEADVQHSACPRNVRYRIVDNRYRGEALKQLITKNKSWSQFRWTVRQIKYGLQMEQYRQFSRMQNIRHAPKVSIQLTLADELHNPSIKSDKLRPKGGREAAALVASAYCGDNQYGSASLKKIAQTAICLPFAVIKLIGGVEYEKDGLTCFNSLRLSRIGAKTVEDVAHLYDCHPFFLQVRGTSGRVISSNLP